MLKLRYSILSAIATILPFCSGEEMVADVVGSLCENNDKFAINRSLPCPKRDDVMLVHDTGAHAGAMGFTYNGRLRPQELLLRCDGSVQRIRRAEEAERDYFSTISNLNQFCSPNDVL